MSINIDLSQNTDLSFVLICIFQEALAKFGKSHKKVKSVSYDVQNGLVVTDEDDVVWKIEPNVKVLFPENLKDLPNHRVSDKETSCFCVNCNFGINPPHHRLCSVCEYLNKI